MPLKLYGTLFLISAINITKYIIAIVFLMGLSSCGIYRQNVTNAPLMQQKGQAQIGGHISFNGLEGQAAYAFTNSMAILANYNNMGSKNDNNNNYIDKHVFKEIGAGLYKKTTKGKIEEVFLIFGEGITSHTALRADSTGKLQSQKVNYHRFLIQADWGGKRNKFEYAFSPRLLGIHYNKIFDNTRTDYKDVSSFHVYAEGAVTIRYYLLKYLMVSSQGCVTIPITHFNAGYNYYYDFSPFNFSIGLIFNINLLKAVN